VITSDLIGNEWSIIFATIPSIFYHIWISIFDKTINSRAPLFLIMFSKKFKIYELFYDCVQFYVDFVAIVEKIAL